MKDDWKEQLQATFEPGDLRSYTGRGGQNFTYVTSRKVAQRLDDVFGPGGWTYDWEAVVLTEPFVVKGVLACKVDGEWVAKSDAGYQNSVRDAETGKGRSDDEPVKSAVTDAMRRCAALWGIGRYLYEARPGQAATAPQRAPQAQHTAVPATAVADAHTAQTAAAGVASTPNGTQTARHGEGDKTNAPSVPVTKAQWEVVTGKIAMAERVDLGRLWGKTWNRARQLQNAGREIALPNVSMSTISDHDLRGELEALARSVLKIDPKFLAEL